VFAQDLPPETYIKPRSPTASLHTDYALFANQGDFPVPATPYEISVANFPRKIMVYYSRGVVAPKLVVFSHGALSDPQVYNQLLGHWASHGFIVLAPIHEDSVSQGALLQNQDARGQVTWNTGAILSDPRVWERRTIDCNAMFAAVAQVEQAIGTRIDVSHPILVGHDFGAFTAQLLLGAKVQMSDGLHSFADPRWFAALLLSPQGAGIMGLTEASWAELARPVMVMTGGKDIDESHQTPQVKADPFFRSKAGYKHFAFVMQGDHTIYSGQRVRPGTLEYLEFEDIKSVTTAFLKAYGALQQNALNDLATDYFSRYSLNRLSMQYR
jgi:hypothetical protein